MTVGRKRRSPRLDIRDLDNQISRYPTVVRTGDVSRTGRGSIFFDDRDSFFYTKYTDSFASGQIVSLPTSIPTGSRYLRNELTTSFYVTGNAIRDNELWMTPSRQFERITPFIESKLFEQDIKDTEFYQTGSSLTEFGIGFLSNLGSKTKISLEVPIVSATQLQPRSASIYYLNNVLGRFEEIATSIRHRPYANMNMWETRLFNHLGSNILSSAVNDVLQMGHIPNTPSEASSLPISYLQDNIPIAFSNMGRLLSLVSTQSALIDSNFEATSSQYIQMDRFISSPFMVEKIIMEIPIKAGPGWLRDFTRFVRLYATNGYRGDPFDTGGPAVTFGIINQLNRNNRDLILSATIIPENDYFIGQDISPLYNERFASGFKSYGKPAYIVSSASNNTFTGTLKMQLEPRISNGVTSLGFFCTPGGYAAYGSNRGDLLRNSFAIAVNPFGRGMRGVASGRSVFGKEFSVPNGDPPSALAKYFPEGIGSYCDTYLYNYEQSAISPYILFPQDKLVFSVSKYRACVSQSAVDGTAPYNFNNSLILNRDHDIWMNTGSIKITMYGSLIRESEEFHDTLNSRLDTNAVHEMIQQQLLDEWDVAGIQEYTGSYLSTVMSGTVGIFNGGPADFAGQFPKAWSRRQLIDSTNFDPKNTFNTSILFSEQVTNYWERVQFFRNAQLICDTESFYDSMIPRFDQIFSIEGARAPYNAIVGQGNMLITLDFADSLTLGYAAIDWTRSFPFEPKYSNLTRTTFIDKTNSRQNPIFGGLYAGFSRRTTLSPVDKKIAIETIAPNTAGAGYTVWGDYENGLFIGLKYEDLIKILYGSGDMNNIRRGEKAQESVNNFYGSTCRPAFRKRIVVSPSTTGSTPDYGYGGRTYRGSLIRGWKYGMISGFETHTKAVFRKDRYGQLRDMLEQRLDTKFYDGASVLSSPVKVQFVGPRGSTVKPENTFSSNLSFEASSSLPYFDGTVRNREEPLYVPSIYSVRFTK